MEKLALECPVPFAVTVMTEIFFYFTIIFFNVYLMDQFNIISITIWTSHGFSAFLIQSPMRDRRNQCMALQRTHHDFFHWNQPTTMGNRFNEQPIKYKIYSIVSSLEKTDIKTSQRKKEEDTVLSRRIYQDT